MASSLHHFEKSAQQRIARTSSCWKKDGKGKKERRDHVEEERTGEPNHQARHLGQPRTHQRCSTTLCERLLVTPERHGHYRQVDQKDDPPLQITNVGCGRQFSGRETTAFKGDFVLSSQKLAEIQIFLIYLIFRYFHFM
ncbi:hypothetical protein [Herbaspirillum seropedicae]|uniref:hypothetical protein n=1 Tax=Herbaspirillum seropedicae TaxID=964 RepID=UPI0028650641|nr:hypothetical protein [Herbaspirillum seropedicae]MDR6398518.1 hypothetical protein [Herbaspirillum seropedicae]